MPLLPREAAASWTLPTCPQKIFVADDMTMMSMYTTTAGAASGVRSRSRHAAGPRQRPGEPRLQTAVDGGVVTRPTHRIIDLSLAAAGLDRDGSGSYASSVRRFIVGLVPSSLAKVMCSVHCFTCVWFSVDEEKIVAGAR
jgi:hypothetical protein